MTFEPPQSERAFGKVGWSWRAQPAQGEAVSGDGLFIEPSRADGNLLFLLVDVAGHGPPAAEVVTLLGQRLLPDVNCANLGPDALLQRLHGMLQPVWLDTDRFVAAVALLIDPRDGSVRAACAGVPPPWCRFAGEGWSVQPIASGIVLGVPAEGRYQSTGLSLGTGGAVLAFSDGAPEARDTSDRQYGHVRMADFLAGLPAGLVGPPLLDALLADLRAHVGEAWPQDDTTLLCFWTITAPENPRPPVRTSAEVARCEAKA